MGFQQLPVVIRTALLLSGMVACLGQGAAASPDAVLLVVNNRVPASSDVAALYRSLRAVPIEHTVTVDVAPDPAISRGDFEQAIDGPVRAWLIEHNAIDRIRYIVLMPGLPVRVLGTAGREGTAASVDSELALAYRRLVGDAVPVAGRVANPYFSSGSLGETPRPFDRRTYDTYLVTRLDGSSAQAAADLARRGQGRPTSWRIVVDGRPPERGGAERRWLQEVPDRLADVRPGLTTSLDESARVLESTDAVTGYFSWGSNDSGARRPPVTFETGAIAASFMSADARTMVPPPDDWQPGRWERPDSYYAGSPEALAVDWLDAGLTGLGAMVTEPYLDAAFRPATLFEAWARGYTLGESFYLALPFLSWQSVVFGDPLARAVEPSWAEPETTSTDELTGLPSAFVNRRVAAISAAHALAEADARLWLAIGRAQTAGNTDHVQEQLETLTARAPGFLEARLMLANVYEARGARDLARRQYRLMLDREPDHLVALNNLAYSLADSGDVEGALPLVDRLSRNARLAPAVLDTVGWVWHLAGRSAQAADVLARVTAADPALCEAWEHYAQALAALSRGEEAERAAARGATCRAEAQNKSTG